MNIEERADREYWYATRLVSEGKVHAARARLLEALDISAALQLAAIKLGELYLFKYEELGIEQRYADGEALKLFEKVIQREPRHAEAWSQKALALLYLERFTEALEAAGSGLAVLPLRVGYAMTGPDVYTNVTEALYDRKVRALLELGRRHEAFTTLSEGLRACPKSEYLTRLVEDFSPDLSPET